MTCPVCCDPFTKIQRKPVACVSCDYSACTRCVKTYLLQTTSDPHCMGCKHFWNREFLDRNLTKSWREGELKQHRQEVLFDRERSLLPATQPAVEIELGKRAAAKEIIRLGVLEKEAIGNHIAISEQLEDLDQTEETENSAKIRKELSQLLAKAREEKEAITAQIFEQMHIIVGIPKEKERRQFVAACPKESCRGFLSTAYKCGTCQDWACPDCREVIGPSKDIPHTCDPALVETMKAIVKDSKACPSCGISISRVEGCDQMFCTQCDTAFSYATGTVITGIIHNPHYFARMRQMGGAPRQHGDVPCGGWPDFLLCVGRFKPFLTSSTFNTIRNMYMTAIHIQDVELRPLPVPDNTDIRVKYLLNDIDEKALQQTLQRRERQREFQMEVRAPLELFVITSLELFLRLRDTSVTHYTEVAQSITPFKTTSQEINMALRSIGDRYGRNVPQIRRQTGDENDWGNEIRNIFDPVGYRPTAKVA